MSYTERKTKTFTNKELIYIYMEPTGFKKTKTSNGYKLDLTQDLEVLDPSGKSISYLNLKGLVNVTYTPTGEVAIRNIINLGNNSKSGQYTVLIKIKDKMSGKTTTKKDNFNFKNV